MLLKSASKAEIAKARCILRAYEKNFVVSLPTSDASRYDMIVQDGKKLIRVQIKYLNRLNNYLEIKLHQPSQGRNAYTKEEIDLLLIYIPKKDVVLAYGPEIFHNRKRIFVSLNNSKSLYFYKKYIW
jgi:PD-(D/E)XK nuclease superfamily protein